ncbi:polymorphic toxin-type HINT domain-containing protein [Streptomyces sp. NPDC020298]|uniref:polymorphic toxin-type HINT domain-containing protein n=1 Tax=unclassified Streptomyces TaxID=2593676 RepID=UPI0033EE2D5C
MAKGKTKPIGKIKTGDKVEAADPKTGKHQGSRAVTATWVNHDYDLIDLRIRLAGGATTTLHTTAKHPFWDDTLHTWIPAGELKPGHALNTATDQHVYIAAVLERPGDRDMYNLTVSRLHTYYVVAGNTPILVHNTGCPTAAALRAAPHPGDVSFVSGVDGRKTIADAGGIQAVSGYSTDIPAGSQRAMPDQVYSAMPIARNPHPFMDNSGGPGAYYLSHAERQAAVLNSGVSISVNREMCDDCISWFQQWAVGLVVHVHVSDPTSINVFAPDGSWTVYDYPTWG